MPQVIGVGKTDDWSQVQESSGVKKFQLDLLQLFLIKEVPSGLKLVGIPEFILVHRILSSVGICIVKGVDDLGHHGMSGVPRPDPLLSGVLGPDPLEAS